VILVACIGFIDLVFGPEILYSRKDCRHCATQSLEPPSWSAFQWREALVTDDWEQCLRLLREFSTTGGFCDMRVGDLAAWFRLPSSDWGDSLVFNLSSEQPGGLNGIEVRCNERGEITHVETTYALWPANVHAR